MSIEYQETRFGKPYGEPKVITQQTEDLLTAIPFAPGGVPFFEYLIIETPDRVHTALSIKGLPLQRYEKEEINKRKLRTTPLASFSDLLLWRRRHYYWKQDSPQNI